MTKKNLADLRQDAANLNKHSERGSALTRKSIEKFGARLAGVIDRNGVIIDGNDRQVAYGELDLDEVEIIKATPTKPVYLQYDDLDLADPDNPARELQVALHRSAVESWTVDAEALLAHMQTGVDVGDWFRQDELDELMAELMPPKTGDTEPQIDKADELRQKWGVELGQLWELGEHRLICGDCTDKATVERVMGGERADLLLTDPPYGIQRDKGFGGFGGFGPPIARRQYSDDWDFGRPAKDTFDLLLSIAGRAIIFGGNFFSDILPQSKHWLVWDKLNTMPTFGDCELAWTNIDRNSVKKYTVEYNGLVGKEKERFHPTQKPVAIMVEILNDYTEQGETVFDPYSGSGTTLIACENLSRRCRAVEISPGYVAVALQRWADHTNATPRLVT